ncbi:MAG: NDP-sugar synthase [bacterium]|nr:NDP-sugar synthase [bacterium]
MRAMIMAAGLGTRLYPITKDIPKCMIPVANIPVMERVIQSLVAFEIRNIIINLYWMKDYVKDYFGDGRRFGAKIAYSEEESLLGTAGGVKKASWFFDNETTIIVSGDGITSINLSELIEFHQSKNSLATIALSPVSDPSQYGVVVTNEIGNIKQFQEKPKKEEAKSNLVNTGIYAFERKLFDLIPNDIEYDFGHQLFPLLLEKKLPFYGYYCDGYWNDIGSLNIYIQAQIDILMKRVNLPVPGQETRSGIFVGKNTYISENAELIPPVVVGNNVQIQKNARLKGPVSINDNCKIEEGARIERSVLLYGVSIGKNVEIKEGIIGSGAILKNNVILKGKNTVGGFAVINESSILQENVLIDHRIEVPEKTELAESMLS